MDAPSLSMHAATSGLDNISRRKWHAQRGGQSPTCAPAVPSGRTTSA